MTKTLSQKNIQKLVKKYPDIKQSPIAQSPLVLYAADQIIKELEALEISKCIQVFIQMQIISEDQVKQIKGNFKNSPNPEKALRDFLIQNAKGSS
jgi:hypothetical protein